MLFVPILQHHELGESKKEDFRSVATQQARLRDNDFDIVLDRLRLAGLCRCPRQVDGMTRTNMFSMK